MIRTNELSQCPDESIMFEYKPALRLTYKMRVRREKMTTALARKSTSKEDKIDWDLNTKLFPQFCDGCFSNARTRPSTSDISNMYVKT